MTRNREMLRGHGFVQCPPYSGGRSGHSQGEIPEPGLPWRKQLHGGNLHLFFLEDMPMAPEELTAALRRQPFVPFRLTLTEGSSYEVHHPELCMAGRRSAI